MTKQIKILGAGSIGNHLAHACREKGWQVTICDIDPAALERTKNDIYPQRYGGWDDGIRLTTPRDAADAMFDAVIIGTPPDSHMQLALESLEKNPPGALLIEKPLCTPALEDCDQLYTRAAETGTRVLVGYNHVLTRNTVIAGQWLQETLLGDILTLHGHVREHWQGIFNAHPWLAGPQDTYLGFTERGGGALAEHSHSVNIWQHFARLTGHGRIVEVSALLDMVEDNGARYDRLAQLNVRTETGLAGLIVQDVITEPAEKRMRIQGSDGFIDWAVNIEAGIDQVRLWRNGSEERCERIPRLARTISALKSNIWMLYWRTRALIPRFRSKPAWKRCW
jgi:predicted dehydrogenase